MNEWIDLDVTSTSVVRYRLDMDTEYCHRLAFPQGFQGGLTTIELEAIPHFAEVVIERDALSAKLVELENCGNRFAVESLLSLSGKDGLIAENIALAADNAQVRTERDELREALGDARSAIHSLPSDRLGMAVSPDGRYEWPIRDELLAKLDAALKAGKGGER